MAERKTEVKVTLVELICDKCGGEMKKYSDNFYGDGHIMRCISCDWSITVGKKYPYNLYTPVQSS